MTRPIGFQVGQRIGPLVLATVLVQHAFAKPDELILFPSDLVVSPNYPAQCVVIQQRADGGGIDRTRDKDLQWRIDGPVIVTEGGMVSLADGPARDETSVCGLTVSYKGQQASTQITLRHRESPSPVFPREVMAVLSKAGCNLGTCHGNLHGKGGFRLSLRGDDPATDYSTIVHGLGGRRIDWFAAKQSLLLNKPSGQLAHQGGLRLPSDSQDYQVLARWIRDGCRWNAQTNAPLPRDSQATYPDEAVRQLRVFPESSLLSRECRQQQLSVVATFADGSQRDVTRWCRYESSAVSHVKVSPSGLVEVQRPMDLSVSIAYLNARAACRLTFRGRDQDSWEEDPSPTRLDQLVETQLRRMRIEPSPISDDSTFLRRTFLVTVGRLPTSLEAREFLAATEPDKRQRLVERLLNDRGFAMLWALRWSDLLRNEQKVMSPRGTRQWHAWMANKIALDRPITEFVTEMIATVGSTYDHPPASFHRTHRDPETAAESIGQVFLGVRLQCARCHNHPFDHWQQDDYYGLAAYFTPLKRKQIGNDPKDKFDKHIISGDEVISLDERAPEIWHPGRSINIRPKPLDRAFERSVEPSTAEKSSLAGLAHWVTHENRMFARNLANRIWYHVMGRGIVDPPDDFRSSNPASHPELLEYLTDELIASNYSTRHLSRIILLSRTYARQASRETDSEDALDGVAMFAGYPLHRMGAEILHDAICDITGVAASAERSRDSGDGDQELSTFDLRTVCQAEVPTRSGFLTTFGKPVRLLVCECERSADTSLGQSLAMVNGLETRDKLASQGNRLDLLEHSQSGSEEIIEELYLASLARYPTAEESQAMVRHYEASNDRRRALEDVLWVLLNSKEFVLVR
jgi:hypothetical protein